MAAAALYQQVVDADPAGVSRLDGLDQVRRNLAMNMAEFEASRPEVYALIAAAPADSRFTIEVTPSGRPTISFRDATGSRRLCDGDDPLAYLAAVMRQLKNARETGQALAIVGTSDGYTLMALARHPVALSFGRQQCIHVFEPNVGNLLACMMIHDMSGENGPIRQPRFQWWIGRDCIETFAEAITEREHSLPFPAMNIASHPDGPALSGRLQEALARCLGRDKERQAALLTRDASVTLGRLLDATSENPGRRPRALLLTTRLSTVLQYSTRDMAEAFEELGWNAEVAIEQEAYHSLSYPYLRDLMLRHDPDLIVQLDHNRAEHGDLFSPSIPFLCWAQDHLPNLTNPAAGAAMGARDYLLTDLGPWYERSFGYPRGNMITLGKLTKIPSLPARWENNGPDLTYVSNASKNPEQAAEDVVNYFGGETELGRLARAAADRLLEAYAQGLSFSGTADIRTLVEQAAWGLGTPPVGLGDIDALVTELFERVNNLCYRQQALGWVANAAEEMGLSLAIYGTGWDKHPRFAPFARGIVEYGAELEKLTRATRINLQVVPYFCLHQRLLDGLAAGGFFLVRSHPADTSIRRLAIFAEKHLGPDVADLEAARALLHGTEEAGELEQLARENAFIADRVDAIELLRIFQGQGMFKGGRAMPPRIEEISFANAQDLRSRLSRFLKDEPLRREVAMTQREAIAETLSYRAGLKRVIGELHRKLQLERDQARGAA